MAGEGGEAGADPNGCPEPGMPIFADCSGQCADKHPGCDAAQCATNAELDLSGIQYDATGGPAIVLRTPSGPGGSCEECSDPERAVARAIALLLPGFEGGGLTSDYVLSVPAPWYLVPTAVTACAPTVLSRCGEAPGVADSYLRHWMIWTDDADAPAVNVTLSHITLSDNCRQD